MLPEKMSTFRQPQAQTIEGKILLNKKEPLGPRTIVIFYTKCIITPITKAQTGTQSTSDQQNPLKKLPSILNSLPWFSNVYILSIAMKIYQFFLRFY